jgi:hypothetical protein
MVRSTKVKSTLRLLPLAPILYLQVLEIPTRRGRVSRSIPPGVPTGAKHRSNGSHYIWQRACASALCRCMHTRTTTSSTPAPNARQGRGPCSFLLAGRTGATRSSCWNNGHLGPGKGRGEPPPGQRPFALRKYESRRPAAPAPVPTKKNTIRGRPESANHPTLPYPSSYVRP